MRRTRRTGVLAIAASLALAAGGLTAIIPASAVTEGEPAKPGIQQEGTLTLKTGATDVVTFGDQAQPLKPKPSSCDLDRTDQSLLAFEGYLGDPAAGAKLSPGFSRDSIGVNEKIASLCYKVDAVSSNNTTTPETLELKLGDSLKNFVNTPMRATSASLDIEVRSSGFPFFKKAKVEATAWVSGGTSPVATFYLNQAGGTSDATNKYCAANTVVDNTNCQWDIAAEGLEFDTLRLKAVSGSFSLEGGGDSQTPATKATTFELVSNVDALIPCPENPATDPKTILVAGTTEVTFVGNADLDDPCTAYGAVLTNGTDGDKQTVQLLKPRTVDPSAQFILDITWTSENTGGPTPTLRDTEIDFEIPAPDPADFQALAFCSTFPTTILDRVDGNLAIVDWDGFVSNVEGTDGAKFEDFDMDSLDDKEFACIDTREADVTEETVTVHDVIFAVGDLRTRY